MCEIFFEKKCEFCGDIFKKEKMWLVDRWGVNNTCHTWCYCTHCMSTAEAVLHEIDTDDCFFGIYGVDENNSAFKKDMTRLNERRERAFDKNKRGMDAKCVHTFFVSYYAVIYTKQYINVVTYCS